MAVNLFVDGDLHFVHCAFSKHVLSLAIFITLQLILDSALRQSLK